MREAKRQYTKRWQSENRDKVNEQQRQWRADNQDHARAWSRAYYQANKDRLAEQRRAERERNKDRVRETNKRYRAANRETLAQKQRLRAYGLSVAEFSALLEQQGHVCASCRGPFPKDTKHQHIDHDHATGKVRGVLCRDCNLALGNVKDSVERLEALIAYLRCHQG